MDEFDAHRVMIRDWTHVVDKGVRVGGLYRLKDDQVKHGALVDSSDMKCELFHRCFGHLHYGALPLIKNMVQGLSDFKI
jgi:hypothetical protein